MHFFRLLGKVLRKKSQYNPITDDDYVTEDKDRKLNSAHDGDQINDAGKYS